MKAIMVLNLLIGLLFAGCAKTSNDSLPAQLPLNKDVVIAFRQELINDNHKLSIAFSDIVSDSRCPDMKENQVECLWEGDGHIRFELKVNDQPYNLELHTNLQPKDTIVDRYRITLVRLDPYPTSTQPIQPHEYRATIHVNLLN